jgi:hypothetical protein
MGPGDQECDQDDTHHYISGRRIDPVKAGLVESFARPGGNVTALQILPEN